MKDWNDVADSLGTETLLEMAQNFFGKRRKIEDELDLLSTQVKELHKKLDRVIPRINLLHALLLDESNLRQFYAGLNIEDPSPMLEIARPEKARLSSSMPYGLTFCRRYAGLLLASYTQAQDIVDEYLHGRWISYPKAHGKKKLSINYTELKAWSDSIDQRINDLNKFQTPSQVLEFTKRMDPVTMEKERIMGGPMGDFAQSLDAGLKLRRTEWKSFGLKKLPDLPLPEKFADRIKKFGKSLCKTEEEKTRQLINKLRSK